MPPGWRKSAVEELTGEVRQAALLWVRYGGGCLFALPSHFSDFFASILPESIENEMDSNWLKQLLDNYQSVKNCLWLWGNSGSHMDSKSCWGYPASVSISERGRDRQTVVKATLSGYLDIWPVGSCYMRSWPGQLGEILSYSRQKSCISEEGHHHCCMLKEENRILQKRVTIGWVDFQTYWIVSYIVHIS